MTENLATFIREIKEGPKIPSEFSIPPTLVARYYRICVGMGIPVYKHLFRTSSTAGRCCIYFHHKDRHACLKRVLKLSKIKQTKFRDHAMSILDVGEVVSGLDGRSIRKRPRRDLNPK